MAKYPAIIELPEGWEPAGPNPMVSWDRVEEGLDRSRVFVYGSFAVQVRRSTFSPEDDKIIELAAGLALSAPSMSNSIKFVVYGKPAQQGSKSAFVKNGKVRMIEQNNARKREWRHSVVCAGQYAMIGREKLIGPVELRVTFFFRRPRSHFGTGKKQSTLKSSSPTFHIQSPDLDKLVRNIGDSLSGVVIGDDRQICSIIARREWTDDSERAEIEVVECLQ